MIVDVTDPGHRPPAEGAVPAGEVQDAPASVRAPTGVAARVL